MKCAILGRGDRGWFTRANDCSNPVGWFMFVYELPVVKKVDPPDESIVAWVDARKKPANAETVNCFAASVLGLSTAVHGAVLITGAGKSGRMVDDMLDLPETWVAKIKSARAECFECFDPLCPLCAAFP